MKNYNNKYKLGVLVSGSGSNLQSIIDATKSNILAQAEISVVISNRKKAYALERAINSGIEAIYLNNKNFSSNEDYDNKVVEILKSHNVDLVILAGYLKIVTSPLLVLYANRILNIHPSLLPAFGGVNMYGKRVHEAVIASKAKKSGCTVHVVTADVDKGPIVDQVSVDVLEDDTPESLAERILIQEHQLYPQAIAKHLKTLVRSLV